MTLQITNSQSGIDSDWFLVIYQYPPEYHKNQTLVNAQTWNSKGNTAE